MSWYRGRYVFNNRNLAQWMATSKKDYHFRVRNKDQADKTVISLFAINQVDYNTTPTVCKEFFNNTQIFYESCALPVHNS